MQDFTEIPQEENFLVIRFVHATVISPQEFQWSLTCFTSRNRV